MLQSSFTGAEGIALDDDIDASAASTFRLVHIPQLDVLYK
jgi:hypothetical protein